MFILGMMCVFIGISLLAPDESKGIIDLQLHVLWVYCNSRDAVDNM